MFWYVENHSILVRFSKILQTREYYIVVLWFFRHRFFVFLDKDTFTVVNPAYFDLYDTYSLKRLTTTKREQYTWKDIGKKKPQEEAYDTDEAIEDEESFKTSIHSDEREIEK
jgi:hypothetical protein